MDEQDVLTGALFVADPVGMSLETGSLSEAMTFLSRSLVFALLFCTPLAIFPGFPLRPQLYLLVSCSPGGPGRNE